MNMMNRNIATFILTLILFTGVTIAQKTSGTIIYERKSHWIKIIQRLPYLKQEEIDRAKLTWGKEDNEPGQKMILQFNANESIYTYPDESEVDNESTWSWRKDDYLIHRNFTTMHQQDWLETLGKTYLIEDELEFPKWKILNEIKEVAGYVCMKAETRDTIKNQVIYAWFTDAVQTQAGPENYCGLPGAILELDINQGDVVITATKIDFKAMPDPLTLPKKMKGKLIKNSEFNKLIQKHIEESIKEKRNPYWNIRY